MSKEASQHLDLATPERVAMTLPVAGIGYRVAAYLLDVGAMFLFWMAVFFIHSLVSGDLLGLFKSLPGWAVTLILFGVFAMQWGYWTVSEVFLDGQTFGKRLMHIRVIRSDGSPVGFFESAVRNLVRAIDFLPALYSAGVTCMLVDRHHRRIGDLAAGTLLVRAEKVDLTKYLAVAAADSVSNATLSTADLELVLSYLERASTIEEPARHALASGLVRKLSAATPADETLPPPTSSTGALEAWLKSRIGAKRAEP